MMNIDTLRSPLRHRRLGRRKRGFLCLMVASSMMIASGYAADDETLAGYWPMHTSHRRWSLINSRESDSTSAKATLSVTSWDAGPNQVEVWFSDKPGQAAGVSDVERYEYCANPGGRAWLFLRAYINVVPGKPNVSHPVQSTRILFTPHGQPTIDLIEDGTYARCGGNGQPYLLWNQDLDSYRIQVWGVLSENPKWKWYWDATVTRPAPITNDCLKPPQTVKAIRVQEAWWNNFSVPAGTWSLGSGDMAANGLPAGTNVRNGRTVWHAQGQMPYYLIGPPDGRTVGQCVKRVVAVEDRGQ
jgi:hypothetical protein